MLSREKRLSFVFVLSVLAGISGSSGQSANTVFRASDIQITPDLAILNSTDTVNFTCSNYRSTDSPLEVNLSKVIPSNEIRLLTSPLNKTALHIRLESSNYIGAFHLLCYVKGERSKGNRADIIVIAAPGILQLAEKCRVYDRQYIKCVIRAPTIARAAQNDYPMKFEFDEIAHSPDRLAYRPRFEFLKNESTKENLTFKWQPTADGVFPEGVKMHMKAILPHFDASSYYFDMTPVFRITPKFNLRPLSSSRIQLNIDPISPAAFCEKSIISKLASNSSQTWTVVEANQNRTVFNNLVSNSLYQVCMKCRQIFSDPDGTQECRDVRTLNRLHWFVQQKLFLLPIILIIAVLAALGLMLFFRRRLPGCTEVKHIFSWASSSAPTDSTSTVSSPSFLLSSQPSREDIDEQYSLLDSDKYQSLAGLSDVLEQSSSPKILSETDA